MPIKEAEFTIKIIGDYSYRRGTDTWRAARIVEAMEGCPIPKIIEALTAMEACRTVGVADPARWITHFAGLESEQSGKASTGWIDIVNVGVRVLSTADYRSVLKQFMSD